MLSTLALSVGIGVLCLFGALGIQFFMVLNGEATELANRTEKELDREIDAVIDRANRKSGVMVNDGIKNTSVYEANK